MADAGTLEQVEHLEHLDFAILCDWHGGSMAPDTETCKAPAEWAGFLPCACSPILRCDPHRMATDASDAAWWRTYGEHCTSVCLGCGVQGVARLPIRWVPLSGSESADIGRGGTRGR